MQGSCAEGDAILELIGAARTYGRGAGLVVALRDVDLRIHAGEFVTVIGPSGSGKSTCLNMLGCLDVPTNGAVRIAGHSVATLTPQQRALLRRNTIGFVLQSPNLIAGMTALENVALPLVYRGVGRDERRARALEALEGVGLAERYDHCPDELSGGQQQRVAIARAIVTKPKVLIADEPTGALDSATSNEIIGRLYELNRQLSLTVVLVTHDPSIAERSPRVCAFRDGLLVADELRKRPAYGA